MPSTVALAPPSRPAAAIAPESRRQVTPKSGEFKPFGEDGLTFGDLLDVINPLHHVPIVNFVYRAITGDTISAASKVAGGALFGGLIGFAAAVADTVLEESSGKDAGNHITALMRDTRGAPGQIPSQPGGSREPPWGETASLRHDANEYDDEFSEPPAGNTDIAARGAPARRSEIPAAQTASLRHDAHDFEDGWWQDPDAAANAENVAAAQPSASAAPPDSDVEVAQADTSNASAANPRIELFK